MKRATRGFAVDAIAFGDVNLDMIAHAGAFPAEGHDVQLSRASLEAGGAGGNVAVGLARLGYRVCVRARVGRDPLGRWLLERMRESGVITQSIDSSTRPTGVVFVVVTPSGQRTMFSARSANLSLQRRDIVRWAGCPVIYVSGYALATSSPREIGKSLARCRSKGSKVMLDVGALLATRGLPSLSPIFEGCDWVVLSDTDLGHLGGTPDTLRRYLARDAPSAFVLHGGARGCELLTPADRVVCAAVPATVVDSTGAGEAFAAGFCAGVLEGYDAVCSARLGNVVAALKLRSQGAQRGLPWRREVRRFIRANRRLVWTEGLESFGSDRSAG